MLRSAIRRVGLGVVATATAASGALLVVPAAHAAGTYNLLILPDQGENAIYNFINTATKTIDVTMYELRDTTVTSALVSKEKAGVKVRVILDGKQTTVNSAAYSALQAGGVPVIYSSSAFTYTHQKTITVDGATSWISTGNLDTKYYATSRDYSVFDTDQNDVSAVEQVFGADFTDTSITPGDGDNLVWSPTDSQTHLLALINGATKTLDVQEEEFQDPALVSAIVAAAQRGVTVRCVLENESGTYNSEISQVEAAGVKVTQYTSSTGFYVHAKAIVADYGTASAKVFQGSENFSDNSLNHNRELGLIISDAGVLTGIENTFTADFNQTPSNGGGGTSTIAVSNPGSQTGTVGTAASVQIAASDSAAGQTLTYSATGLPAGLAVNSATGAISGTPTTAGTDSVTVTGTGGSCAGGQLLADPGFENGTSDTAWTASNSDIINNDTTDEPAHTGSWDAWLGGNDNTTDTLAQTVTIPSGCTNYTFSFWLHTDTAETSTTKAYDTLTVQVLDGSGNALGTVHSFTNLNANTGFAQQTYSLAQYAGKTVTLQFTGKNDYEDPTSWVIDDTALTVS
ncbi:putative Ig domain-containing protein [Catenulispora sp. NF23]|uniref:phospholipase D-like domain-containing protein n=1 Tax=Catenulispora pinistramenti TaxID=2705254 RepID=UPI001BA7900E|nr:phospholipase D-like domain-containing protein [Catenulispora pinistramenti]MBS2537987.1 putative Ig domain-containing protein [Catenulispora pinistramenti]